METLIISFYSEISNFYEPVNGGGGVGKVYSLYACARGLRHWAHCDAQSCGFTSNVFFNSHDALSLSFEFICSLTRTAT